MTDSDSSNGMINLLTDFGFKRFFGTEAYKKNLICFLNAFLTPNIGPICDISYLQTEQLGFQEKEKRLIFDVYCSTSKDDRIIVEMQKANQEFIKNRLLAYAARTISNSLNKGDRKYNFPTVITIILVDFELLEMRKQNDFLLHVMLKDDTNRIFSEKMSFLLVDLTKFATQMNFEKFTDERKKWCYAIKNMWRMTENEIPREDKIFRELYEECQLTKLNNMEKQEYEKSVLEYEDVKDAMEYHHRLGIAEGIEQGVEQGRKQGVEDTKRQIIVSMIEEGLSIATVAKFTNMKEEEVERSLGDARIR